MLLASCPVVLGDDAVIECGVWIEEKISLGQSVVVLFDDATSCLAVLDVTTPSLLLRCIHVSSCTSYDDFVLFAALYAAEQGVPPDDLLRFNGAAFESLDAGLERASHLLFLVSEINTALSSNDDDRARNALGILRALLKAHSGTLSAEAYRRAGDCKLLIEACRNRHYAALQDGSLMVRSKQRPIEAWVELFPLLDVARTISALTAWSEVALDLHRLHTFVNSGKLALDRDIAAINRGENPNLKVMLWLAAYLVRIGEHRLAQGDGAAALALSVNALELYIKYSLYEWGVFIFDFLRKDLDLTSVGKNLFSKYNYGEGVKGSLMVLTDPLILGPMSTGDVEEAIRLRNQSILTHGVQRLSYGDAKQAFTRVKAFIKAVEARKSAMDAQWTNLHAEAFVIDWSQIAPKIFAEFVAQP